jgi:hypothetical protein
MIDYAEHILKLKIGERKLHNLLLENKLDEAAEVTVEMAKSLREIRNWIMGKQIENHEYL